MRLAKATHADQEFDSVPAEFVNELTSNTFKSLTYTADIENQVPLTRSLSVDGIISNFAERIGL